MEQYLSKSPEDTQAIASHVIAALASRAGTRATATIIALRGDLGAGKTVFTQGVAHALGVDDPVTSPTFVIERVYQLPDTSPWKHLVHIDAYRLEGEAELDTIGWADVATNPGNLVVIEWPERVGLGVPERALWIDLKHVSESRREIVWMTQDDSLAVLISKACSGEL